MTRSLPTLAVRGLLPLTLVAVISAMTAPAKAQALSAGVAAPAVGTIDRLDPALDALVDPTAKVEFLGEGYIWSEGPVWSKQGGFLLFSDVPSNTVYKFKEGEGVTPFLKPSGYTGTQRKGGIGPRRRRRARLERPDDRRRGPTDSLPARRSLRRAARRAADRRRRSPPRSSPCWPIAGNGKRFDSPNDVVRHSSGAIYFTDPPYGLVKGGDVATREIDFNGVYRIAPDGKVTLVTRDMTKPNGLAFSPDQKIAVRRPVRRRRAVVAGVSRERRRFARRAEGVLRRDGAGRSRQAGRARRLQGRRPAAICSPPAPAACW